MKKIFKYTIIGAILISFNTSCDDYLEEHPTNFISPEQFYNTRQDAEIALLGMYGRLANSELYGRDLEMITMHGDPIVSPNRVITLAQARYDYQPNFGDFDNIWKQLYILIGDANKAIGRIEASVSLSDEDKKQPLGEALFLRAYCYYTLQQLWGGVPLWTKELTDNADEIASLPRATVEEVRVQIVNDLLEIEKRNLLPASYDGDFIRQRATKWAAKSLLAKTYLYQQDWANAEAAAADIIANGGYELMSDYKDIFTEENEYNKEIILTVDFEKDIKVTSRGERWGIRPRDENASNREPWMGGFGHYVLRKSFLDTFDPADKRLEGIVFDKNLAGNTLNFTYMAKYQRTDEIDDKNGINFILFRLADILLVHAEAAMENNDLAAAEVSLNKVRSRAGIPALTGLSKDNMRQAVRRERIWELAGENQGKLDRMRWGTLVDDIKALPALSQAAGEKNGLVNMAQIQADNIQSKHLLLPIPEAEIQKNPNLTQNPDW